MKTLAPSLENNKWHKRLKAGLKKILNLHFYIILFNNYFAVGIELDKVSEKNAFKILVRFVTTQQKC